jgi:hypothetical protein
MTARDVLETSKYFTVNENWGDIDKVDPGLIIELEHYRSYLNFPIHISPVPGAVYAESGHEDESWHKIITGRNRYAMAADVFPECNLLYAWFTTLRFGFNGIGVYPYAAYPAKKLVGMLHLDMRHLTAEKSYRTLWYQDVDKEYVYLHSHLEVRKLVSVLLLAK